MLVQTARAMIRPTKIALLALSVSTLGSASHSQSATEAYTPENEGTRHLLVHADPVYPAIARAAHIQGDVLLHVSVDASGHVTKVEAVGGPPMLVGSAVEAVKKWVYQPFVIDGKPAPARLIVSVPFSLGIPDAQVKSDQTIGQAYFPKADECRSANAAGHWQDAVKSCGEALAVAERFPDQASRSNELRLAHEEFGEALAFSGNLSDALEQFRITVGLADKYLKPTDQEYASAYYWQAFAEHASHMPDAAERDYSIAEASYRQAIEHLPEMRPIYSRYLAQTLVYHSVLVAQMGDTARAQTMRTEAVSLNPHALDILPKGN